MFFCIGFNQLPFEPTSNQVIYVENEYNEKTNRFIQSNYEDICTLFQNHGWEFCYLPYYSRELYADTIVNYYAPYTTKKVVCDMRNDFLLQYMKNPSNRANVPPSLLYYSSHFTEEDACVYRGISLEDEMSFENDNFSSILKKIEHDITPQNTRFRCIHPRRIDFGSILENSIVEAENIDTETIKLLKEFEEQANRLKKRGISTYILEQIINKPPLLSKLVITSDFRIVLPDYNNREIELTPLVKAVYLLFLRHPEGIIFKHLTDYRDELKEIYKQIKGDRWIVTQISSINDVTNTLKNSINEKCARIKGAFISQFDERLANYYIISGERGEPKRIILPQDLIIWE